MSEHRATIEWERGPAEFRYPSYPRDHTWSFDGGMRIDASAAPGYLGNADFVDPEEAYVASLSSCHMLTFLAIAAREGLVVDRYRDAAVGYMERNAAGRLAVVRVFSTPRSPLRPRPRPRMRWRRSTRRPTGSASSRTRCVPRSSSRERPGPLAEAKPGAYRAAEGDTRLVT